MGLAEALCRMDKGREALAVASEAHDQLTAMKRPVEAAVAGYWLAAAQFQVDNSAESKALLQQILSDVRAGLNVSSDFRMRLLVALAMNESADGEHEHALAYLEEARGLEDEMDDLRRARYLYNLAVEYQETGDYEAALRASGQAAALFRAADSEREIAALENLTALIHADLGNTDRASAALARAQEVAGALPGDERFAASMADTQARIHLKEGRADDAEKAARTAIDRARRAGVLRTVVAAQLTLAQALDEQGREDEALDVLSESVDTARQRGGKALLRRALGAYAAALAQGGRHQDANQIYEEALRV
jgi:tetratricopeptide (TPR) repeat protein